MFNKEENFLPVFFGNNWEEGTEYKKGDEIVYKNYWYKYIGDSNNVNPYKDTNAEKGEHIPMVSGINESYYANDFIVFVPEAVYNTFSETDIVKLKDVVNYYKLAEMRYKIKIGTFNYQMQFFDLQT